MAAGETYFTPFRVNLARFQAAIARLHEIVQEVFKLSLEEKLVDYWDDGDLWKRWIDENHAFVKKYRFFKQQSKEKIGDVEIPIFAECDVTFLAYLLPKVTSDLEGINAVREIRNHAAHGTRTEMEEDEFEDEFTKIEDAVISLFEHYSGVGRKWGKFLSKIRRDEMGNLRPHLDAFERQMQALQVQITTIDNSQIVQNLSNAHRPVIFQNCSFGGEVNIQELTDGVEQMNVTGKVGPSSEGAVKDDEMAKSGGKVGPSSEGAVKDDEMAKSGDLSGARFDQLNKNPVSKIMEYAQTRRLQCKIEVLSETGPPHDPRFTIAVSLGDRQFPSITSKSKKEGKCEAADAALRTLIAEGECKTSTSEAANQGT